MRRTQNTPVTIISVEHIKGGGEGKVNKHLLEDINENGQIMPIIVSKLQEENHYKLEAGRKRLIVAKHLDWKKIKATVINIDNEYDEDMISEWIQILEAQQSYKMTDYDLAQKAVMMEEKFQVNGRTFAAQTGMATGYIYNLMRWFRNAPDKVKVAWRENNPHLNQVELERYSHMTKSEASDAWELRLKMRTSPMETFHPKKTNGKQETIIRPRRASERQIVNLQMAVNDSPLIQPAKKLASNIIRFVLGADKNVPGITDNQEIPQVLKEIS